jgi:phosphoribosyl-AMP cyclohydrolase
MPAVCPRPASVSSVAGAALVGHAVGTPAATRNLTPMPAVTAIAFTPEQLDAVRFNAEGLVPAIVQEAGTGTVLMMAWMNAASLRETLDTGRTVFWSRSRDQRWRKGDTSGEHQWVRRAYYDCDGDTLLLVVDQDGRGACHTGEHSCFYRAFGPTGAAAPAGGAS